MQAVAMNHRIEHRFTSHAANDTDGLPGDPQVSPEQKPKIESSGESELTGREPCRCIGIGGAIKRCFQRVAQFPQIQIPEMNFAVPRRIEIAQGCAAGDEIPRNCDQMTAFVFSIHTLSISLGKPVPVQMDRVSLSHEQTVLNQHLKRGSRAYTLREYPSRRAQ